ncbi:hypothetical protein UCD39_13555 [Nitrospirillum sp. BR 11752]|uniref:hypothetical protein n=1 Tax=Nitrospirillum sp. BR 11752 TaxID=3104293 RepID=UPI002E98BBA6|nr:hypothetical protein [Nitrospirillum sp. BR 11752]
MAEITNPEPGKWQVRIRTNQGYVTKTFSTKAEAEKYIAQLTDAPSEDTKDDEPDEGGPSL